MKKEIVMKKGLGYSRVLVAVFVVAAFSAYGQSNEDASAVAADGPAMPTLFFTGEQRRLLEAVRQEFISHEDLAIDEFVPLVLRQELVELEDESEENLRGKSVQINALVRNRQTGRAKIWLNGEQFDLRDSSGVLDRDGLSALGSGTTDSGSLSIVGTDTFNLSRFVLKVGQRLSGDGEVDETYPVIIIRKK